jgi:hypothetical protein
MYLAFFLYIDPGSGFGIAQILTALVGAYFVLKVKLKQKFNDFANRIKGKKKIETDKK